MGKSNSFDGLINHLDSMLNSVDDDADEILERNARELTIEAQKNAKSVMNKGYWTGTLARMIEDTKSGHLNYEVTSNAHYSAYLEYGTRYMEPETFMFPAYQKIQKSIQSDFKKIFG
ncbi:MULTISPECIES: HK97-gp10 family putative phage morphogenesis protein [Staphylococcus]|uniref:HK97 gp10 family phage protein n=1 Tax=Staphylococcus hsinchuensis TaxID=3051183 RepID=A0ABZ3EEH2_9STAP|nr:HK97-gp10 family putative phage morphogenesis protein [Staphylococcus sp. Marseille-Q6910]